ncbi:MAG: peptidylprolyl isomerase [Neisseria sp.]|nr:peptidylprolyl isomerase [Neisseria sp.]
MKSKFIFSTLMLTLATSSVAADIKAVDRIAAVAGGTIITNRDVNHTLNTIVQNNPEAKKLGKEQLRSEVLSILIDQALLLGAAKRRGITASEAEIDANVAQNAAARKLSVDAFYKQNSQQGQSRNELRKDIANQIIAQKVRQQYAMQNVRVSDEEVNQAYAQAQQQGTQIPLSEPLKQYRAQHILLQTPTADSVASAESAIKKIAQLARNGQDFAALAREYSQDGSATQGGDLGWFGDGMMVPEFENAVHKLKVGQMSEPVQTQFGWHLIKLNDVREMGTEDDRRRNTVRRMLEQQKMQAATQKLLQQLKEAAHIEIRN